MISLQTDDAQGNWTSSVRQPVSVPVSTVNTAVTVFRHAKYLFLPLQTIMKAQMMMQMRAMQTPTVIPVIDFWSRW